MNTYEERNSPMPIEIRMDRAEAAKLYVVLSDNARTWNVSLRAQLHQRINATDAYNARLELQGKVK